MLSKSNFLLIKQDQIKSWIALRLNFCLKLLYFGLSFDSCYVKEQLIFSKHVLKHFLNNQKKFFQFNYLYIEIQKRFRIEAVEKTTSIALYMSHSQTEKSQWLAYITLIALNTIAPIDTDKSENSDHLKSNIKHIQGVPKTSA